MKKRFTEEQIIKVLKEYQSGKKAMDICRENGISDATGRIQQLQTSSISERTNTYTVRITK